MKKLAKLFGTRGLRLGAVALAVAIGLSITACGDAGGGGDSTPAPNILNYGGVGSDGTIYSLKITENTASRYVVKPGDYYELIIIKINCDKNTSTGTVKNVVGVTLTLSPTVATGVTFDITLDEKGIVKISGTITFIDGTTPEKEEEINIEPIEGTPPEAKPVADRWSSWADGTATIKHSVASDGVCTVTVGGDAVTDTWGTGCDAEYTYTGRKGIAYEYTFEAWTDSGDRDLYFKYYSGWQVDEIYLIEKISITNERNTYTVRGDVLPNNEDSLGFQCGNQFGTFYVKILSIKEVP